MITFEKHVVPGVMTYYRCREMPELVITHTASDMYTLRIPGSDRELGMRESDFQMLFHVMEMLHGEAQSANRRRYLINEAKRNKIYDEIEAEIKGSMVALSDVQKAEIIMRVMNEHGCSPSEHVDTYNALRDNFLGRSL